uniref:DUF4216 domain-containing protein n=1 Tax=Tanacetum cinerariifolium TaxID=118510 RepID=A0A699H1R4_TANCI|nr:hypothetical protein [Tanacetum cinerariifolium]
MYYGQLEQILEFSHLSFKTLLFRVKWFDTSNKRRIQNFVIRNNITQIKENEEAFKNDQYILASQVKQCFYLKYMARRPLGWKVIEHVSHKRFSNGGVIVVEDDPDVIYVDNSPDLALSISLNDMEIAALHIDGQFVSSEFPKKDMKEEFLGVRKSSELFTLGYGPSHTPISVNSCVVNGLRFIVYSRDERRTTQNSGICLPGPDEEMYYGQLEQILDFSYLSFKTMLFRVKWFDTSNKRRIQNFFIRKNITQIKENEEAFKNDQYILATQVKQCFYLEDMARQPLGWKVVKHMSHKRFSNGGVIVVDDDPDVIYVDSSSDLALSTSLNDLEITALHTDSQSIDVDAPLDIIDVDEDDDIIDEEDLIPHDLVDSNDEDLVNLDIDDGVNMSADVARGHGGDSSGDDRPLPYHIPIDYGGCLVNRGKGTRKLNLGGRRAGMMHTHQETQNLGLKAITDKNGPVPIRFEFGNRETLMPLGDHATHWANYLGVLVRELSLYHPSWRQMPSERKAGVMEKIEQHLQKIFNGKKTALNERYWVPDVDGTYDVERIRYEHRELSYSRVPVADPYLLFDTYCWRRILEPRGESSICSWLQHPTPTMRSWSLFAGASSGGTSPVLDGFCQDMGWSFRSRLHAHTPPMSLGSKEREAANETAKVASARMMSREMMRTAARMRRMGTIVRRYWIDVGPVALTSLLVSNVLGNGEYSVRKGVTLMVTHGKNENKLESMKILKNKLESMKILGNKLESLKLQENQPVDGLIPFSIKRIHIRKCFREAVKETTSSAPQGHAKASYGTFFTRITV